MNQSIIRKVGNIGCSKRFREDDEWRTLVKCLPALAFVPQDEVLAVYEELKQLFPEDSESDELLTSFELNYIRSFNIRTNCPKDAKHPIELWNQYCPTLLGEPRTTNACEGFHYAFQSLLFGDHPSIWKLMEGIRKDIAVQKKSVIDESSGQKGSKRKKYTTLNKRVQSTVEKYYTYTDKMKYLRYLVVLQGGSAVKPIED